MSFDTQLPDFDFMARLAKDDPAAFEAMRTQLLNEAVAAAPERMRASLRQTLDTMNQARAGKTPLEAAEAANTAMLSSLRQLGTAMDGLKEECTSLYVESKLKEIAAKR